MNNDDVCAQGEDHTGVGDAEAPAATMGPAFEVMFECGGVGEEAPEHEEEDDAR